MKTSLRLSKTQLFCLSILFCILGISLFFFDTEILSIVIRISGLAVIIYGLFALYQYLVRHVKKAKLLFYGIASFFIGILMMAMPDVLIGIFPIVTGMILLISSFSQMQKAFILSGLNDKGWIFDFLVAVVLLLAGLMLIVEPAFMLNYILKVSGVLLFAEGCFNMYESYRLSSRMEALKSAF